MQSIISVSNLTKVYASGFRALNNVDLEIHRGEIFALLGSNGAGKTTLISIICGVVKPTSGTVRADGYDIIRDYRAARSIIGLVPQELTVDLRQTVWESVKFNRGLFGRPPNSGYLEKVLRDLSLWEKKDSQIATLSGGMKRRLLIAKALSHEPRILFLDEPTAGVDVELRRKMWDTIRALKENGVTIILTSHYLEEAEELATRVGIIRNGAIILIEDKITLMETLGKRRLTLHLQTPLTVPPSAPDGAQVELTSNGCELVYTFENRGNRGGVATLLRRLDEDGVRLNDFETTKSSLEDIFVGLMRSRP